MLLLSRFKSMVIIAEVIRGVSLCARSRDRNASSNFLIRACSYDCLNEGAPFIWGGHAVERMMVKVVESFIVDVEEIGGAGRLDSFVW